MPDREKRCYGCGEDVGGWGTAYATFRPLLPDGEIVQQPMCPGRSTGSVSRVCLRRATEWLAREGYCPGCGEVYPGNADERRITPDLCDSCTDKLRWGHLHRDFARKGRKEVLAEIKREVALAVIAGKGQVLQDPRGPSYFRRIAAGGRMLTLLGTAMEAACSDYYLRGLQEGSELLKGLASGTLHLSDVQAAINEAETQNRWRHPSKDDFQAALVEAAKAELDLQEVPHD